MKPKPLSLFDCHALAAFFAMHHGALASKGKPRPTDIERVVMATFGLVEKKGPFRLTPRGKRAIKLARSDI